MGYSEYNYTPYKYHCKIIIPLYFVYDSSINDYFKLTCLMYAQKSALSCS